MVKRCGAALRDAYEWRRCCSGGEVREGAKCAASRESGSLVESERTRKEQGRKREEEAWPAHFFFQNDKAVVHGRTPNYRGSELRILRPPSLSICHDSVMAHASFNLHAVYRRIEYT